MSEGRWRCSGPEINKSKSKVSAGGNDNDVLSFVMKHSVETQINELFCLWAKVIWND